MPHPTPSTWTLRFKSHRTTLLLHIDPLQTFASIKATLHSALHEAGIQASTAGPAVALPSSAAEMQLGRPVDALDPSQGFELGAWEGSGDEDEVAVEEEGKGKGRAVGRKGAEECPKGAGLKDGAVLAVRWEGDGAPRDRMWGVQMASFEDAYGVQNEMDGGARAEFEG